jgi:hypothetical protein
VSLVAETNAVASVTRYTALSGIPVVQTDTVGQGPGRHLVFTGDRVFIPATRPTLRFPLTEAVAAKWQIDLWYFDPSCACAAPRRGRASNRQQLGR